MKYCVSKTNPSLNKYERKKNLKKYKQEKANRKIWATLLSIRNALKNFQKQRLERITAEEGFLDPYSGF